ncbi:hypothetical protein QUF63_05985 [Anaerolineales bacterium HSG25]|nr:hypothetical protein [Anaerolineales bacterium HSG25]
MLTFKDCTLSQLDETFHLTPLQRMAVLESWLTEESEILEAERNYMLTLQAYLQDNVINWNEQELAMHFIGPMFTLVQFSYQHRFNLFAERSLSGTVEGVEMGGKPDGMIATGYREPKKPYFCLQEYKREQDPNGDPAGQALAAMLVAQEINKHKFPIYGCYIRGRHWHFMTLQGKEYCLSDSYVATRSHIFDIFRILKTLKQIIIRQVDSE